MKHCRASLALFSIRAVIPRDPSTPTVDKVAEIRDNFGPDLFRFQQFVDQVAQSLPEFGDQADPAGFVVHM